MAVMTRSLESELCRHDLPTGAVPPYREFVKRVWAWREEDDKSCIDSPPWMYSIIVQEPAEVCLVSSLLATLHRVDAWTDCFEVRIVENGSEFSFANLAALHAFLRSCAALGSIDDTAGSVCEYVMWTLGFRWV